MDGYRRALAEANITFNPNSVISGDLTITGGINAAHDVIRRKVGCTAYFCANDESAIGFIQGLKAGGIRVPDDIAVVGFDDIEEAKTVVPALTTLKSDLDGLGRMGVHRLLERVNYPNLPFTRTILEVQLVERDSAKTYNLNGRRAE